MSNNEENSPASSPCYSTGNEEEDIKTVIGYLAAAASCEEEMTALRTCAEENNVSVDDEQGLRSACATSVESFFLCTEIVKEDTVELLSDISAQLCPQEYALLQACAERHGESNPSECQREFISTLACGSKHVLNAIHRSLSTDVPQ